MPEINVLVMAAGSPLGQSITKAILKSEIAATIFVADISESAAGFYFDNVNSVIFPLIDDESYEVSIKTFVKERGINVIFPVISKEHNFFAKNRSFFIANQVHVITCDENIYELCNDKYLSMNYLLDADMNAPSTIIAEDGDGLELFLSENKFPMILKPRFGASSNDVYVVKNVQHLMSMIQGFPAGYFVLQQFLADPKDYTVGVYRDSRSGRVDTMILERNLKFGLSYSGKILQSDSIKRYCQEIANSLRSSFSINVQLKMVGDAPYAYEINPRLSSTTCVRANFGFNEPEMILREIFDLSPSSCTPLQSGQFMRYWQEIYLKS